MSTVVLYCSSTFVSLFFQVQMCRFKNLIFLTSYAGKKNSKWKEVDSEKEQERTCKYRDSERCY